MEIQLAPGTYVVAVSGGVDSMTLLDLLARKQKAARRNRTAPFCFVVAHLDHGIRPNSHLDRRLVQSAAHRHKLAFVYDQVELGPAASEATARWARYEFLNAVKRASGATAIITAHHGDDLVETAILNLLRGSGRKGLTALYSDEIIRPLIEFSKRELVAYGKSRGLTWREDPTNRDVRYRRNYIRRRVVPRLGAAGLAEFKKTIQAVHRLNREIDGELAKLLQKLEIKGSLKRADFIKLPHAVALEIMAAWLRGKNVRQFSKKTLERLVVAAKTFGAGKQADVVAKRRLVVGRDKLSLTTED